jgi:hypothetical protein
LLPLLQPFLILFTEVSLVVDSVIIELFVAYLLTLVSLLIGFVEHIEYLDGFPYGLTQFSIFIDTTYLILQASYYLKEIGL